MKNGQKVRSLCHLLRFFCNLGAALVIPMRALYWILCSSQNVPIKVGVFNFHFADHTFEKGTSALNGFLIDLLPSAFFIALFLLIGNVLKSFEESQFFSERNIRLIRRVGWCILLGEILSPFYLALQNHILSGSDTLHVIVSPYTELKILFLIFGIYMLSFILQHGQYLEEEHRGTI